jgi:ribosomal protein L12E/L44/L45/RPP1/RPP2
VCVCACVFSKVLESVGADYQPELIEKAVNELNGKDIDDLIEQ